MGGKKRRWGTAKSLCYILLPPTKSKAAQGPAQGHDSEAKPLKNAPQVKRPRNWEWHETHIIGSAIGKLLRAMAPRSTKADSGY